MAKNSLTEQATSSLPLQIVTQSTSKPRKARERVKPIFKQIVKHKLKKVARPTLQEENRVGYPRLRVAGVDEVGRGCIAGPVVAGAVLLPAVVDYVSEPWLLEVTDSKALVAAVRERLAPKIWGWALSAAIGLATVEEIDQINIFHASHLAMLRAVDALLIRPQQLLIDGKFLPKKGLSIPASAIIQGDLKSLSIACGSIIAKVWRDRLMVELDREFPGYGLAGHKGYPTPEHVRALRANGVLKIHRRSFRPVAVTLLNP